MQRIIRYGAVGLANTVIGFGLIWLGLLVGMDDYSANILGYTAGLTFSFFANRRFTFRLDGPASTDEALRFGGCFAIAYSANLLVVTAGKLAGLGGSPLLHLLAMVTYSAIFFVLMRGYAFKGEAASGDSCIAEWVSARAPELGLAAMALVALALMYDNPMTHDVVWQFWIARQMLGGAQIYRDIWEVNPPLWFWSAMPVEWLAGITRISPFSYLVAIIITLSAFTAWSTARLGDFTRPLDRFKVFAGVFWACCLLNMFDFGQREQFALIGALPYAAIIARRAAGKPLETTAAIAIGLLAAYGLALKHYFVAVPVLLEGWLWYSRGRSYRPFRPETLVLAGAALAYGAAVVLLAPAFFTDLVPMVSLAYKGYEEPWYRWFDEVWQIIWLMALLGMVRGGRIFGREAHPLTSAFALVALGFAIAYFAQLKGWSYHALPVTGALLCALIVRMVADPEARLKAHPFIAIAIGYAALMGAVHGHYKAYLREKDETIVRLAKPGETIAILDADPMWTWPVVEENGLRWNLPFYSLWMIPAIAHAEAAGPLPPDMQRLADKLRQGTLDAMRCAPPATIMFGKSSRYPLQPKTFSVSSFFRTDPAFAEFLQNNYHQEIGNWYFDLWRRNGAVEPTGAHCRAVVDPRWPVNRYDSRGHVIGLAPVPSG